jgi:hypothetical protein
MTRRDDIEVYESKDDNGFDLTARLLPADSRRPRCLGVQIRGEMAPTSLAQAEARLDPLMAELQETGDANLPSCVFFVTVKQDQLYFAWVREPVVEGGRAFLRVHKEATCLGLDNDSFTEIVECVREWYAVPATTNGAVPHEAHSGQA